MKIRIMTKIKSKIQIKSRISHSHGCVGRRKERDASNCQGECSVAPHSAPSANITATQIDTE
jgi:hypothetical protein